ncbi:MAG: peptidoglycan editing factor PgeF [Hyphomicrobiaceae bacterium]
MAERIEAASFKEMPGLAHGFFTRNGGVSSGLYGSLNCGPGSSDAPQNVQANRARVADALGAASDRLLTVWQVHSPDAVIVDGPWTGERPKADALVTATPGLAIGVLTADCTPILFADPQARVIGAAHAGWRGALAGVIERTVEAMAQLGARRERIAATIGPTIGPESYEIGPEFEREFTAAGAGHAAFFHTTASGRRHFDLPRFCRARLEALGIGRVEDLELDTYAGESRFFSYRRTTHRREADYGRQISAIVLK